MASLFYAYSETLPFLAGELFGARLLGIEMVETRRSSENFSVLGDLQSFGK